MAKSKNSRLSDSWVVSDGGVGVDDIEDDIEDNMDDDVDDVDDDISWKEDSDHSSAEGHTKEQLRTVKTVRRARTATSKPGRSPRETEPGLVFPTIESPPPKPQNIKSVATPTSSPLRQRGAATPSTRSPGQKASRPRPRPRPSTTKTRATPSPVPRQHLSRRGLASLDGRGGDFLLSLLEYVLSILKSIFIFLRQPIAVLLVVYLFAGIVSLTYNLLTNSTTNALSPLCRLPLSSAFPTCSAYSRHSFTGPSISDGPSAPAADPEFDTLMSTHDQLSEILSSTSAAVSLPMDMKRSEASIRDLRQLVRFSSLPTRNELIFEFDGFIDTARRASYDLQKFNSHVGRTIDIVLSTARWTERVLDDMALQEGQSPYLSSSLFAYLGYLLAPFQPLADAKLAQTRLLETYIAHTRIMSDQLSDLIAQASALLLTLQSLEDGLEVIHAIGLQSQHDTQISRADTLSHLWTMLGGNRANLARYDSQLQLLRQVGEYRRLAWAHVSSTLVKLQAMQAELEELRERVGSAEAEVAVVPRARHRTPLAVHLQAIRLGVERLEGEGERARSVQRAEVAKAMDAGSASIPPRALDSGDST